MKELIIVGGGLSGSEAAWQAAERGCRVQLFEMRPASTTGAHQTDNLAELVCSNSLGSNLPDRASGVLKNELRLLDSMLLDCAEKTSVPAGRALAVDRNRFSALVTEKLEQHPHISIVRKEITKLSDNPTIVASGPLTSPALSKALKDLSGQEHLYFYDALAPIVELDSIDFTRAFRAERYDFDNAGEGDYINCPLNKEEYDLFVNELIGAERIPLREFESTIEDGVKAGIHKVFEGCMPIEILARRGHDALAYGPMRPVGLKDPRTGNRPHAVLQLRQDNLAGTLYNLVGFQTNLTYAEQKRVFSMIPGLEHAEYVRFGQMHRNTFLNSPACLEPTLQFKLRPDLFFCGQITGVEGYMGNIATGLLAGVNAARFLQGKEPVVCPPDSMLGALAHYITHSDVKHFQPMKANFGILPPLGSKKKIRKSERGKSYAERALSAMQTIRKTAMS